MDKNRVEAHLQTLDGVVTASVALKKLPNVLIVHFRPNQISLRTLVEEVKGLGYKEAHYAPEGDKTDIRVTLQDEVNKYRNRFLMCLLIQLPIWILIWIVAYTNPMFVIKPIIGNVLPVYLLIIIVLSTIIQFYLGMSFYIGAYKSVRHGSANMDVLVVLGTTAAWLYGILLLFIGNPFVRKNKEMAGHEMEGMTDYEELSHVTHAIAHNFEVSSTLITAILLGKLLESFSKKQTVDKLSQLASLKVTKANLIDAPPKLEKPGVETDVDLLCVGDFVKV